MHTSLSHNIRRNRSEEDGGRVALPPKANPQLNQLMISSARHANGVCNRSPAACTDSAIGKKTNDSIPTSLRNVRTTRTECILVEQDMPRQAACRLYSNPHILFLKTGCWRAAVRSHSSGWYRRANRSSRLTGLTSFKPWFTSQSTGRWKSLSTPWYITAIKPNKQLNRLDHF
jgi:hypothetical protein